MLYRLSRKLKQKQRQSSCRVWEWHASGRWVEQLVPVAVPSVPQTSSRVLVSGSKGRVLQLSSVAALLDVVILRCWQQSRATHVWMLCLTC
jgi:hypothetical protein